MPDVAQTYPDSQDQVTLGLESLLSEQDIKQPDWTLVGTDSNPSDASSKETGLLDPVRGDQGFLRVQMEGLYVDPLKTKIEVARQALKKLSSPASEQNRAWRRTRGLWTRQVRELFELLEAKTIPFLLERSAWA